MAHKKYRKYEMIYLVQPEATDEERARVRERLQQVFESSEAWVLSQEDWGKRKLSYEIQKHNKAYYQYIVYIAAPGVSAELERVLRMLDPCIRFLTIKLEDDIREERIPELTAASENTDAAPAEQEA